MSKEAHVIKSQISNPGVPNYNSIQQPQVVYPQNVAIVVGNAPSPKSLCEAYMLWFPLGILGLHHFYLGRCGWGALYFFTCGLGGVGWLADGCRMPELVRRANKKLDKPEEFEPVLLSDAYVLWFPFGILGFHHYYLRRPGWGLLYTFTGGLFGIGWLVDCVRLPSLVREANIRLEQEHRNHTSKQVDLCAAYGLGATPLGLLGAHHFYMGNIGFGFFYLLTAGGAGIGWIVDWFRMKCLVDRANHPELQLLGKRHKYLDDAYVMAVPFGLLGAHHFYLERPGWGVLYLFTGGLGGIGWLVDLARMPCLVHDTNRKFVDEMSLRLEICQQLGTRQCHVTQTTARVEQPGPAMTYPASATETPILNPPPYSATAPGAPPASTGLNAGVPYNGVPYNGVPYNGVPYNGVPYNGLPYNGVPYNGVPYNGVPNNGVPATYNGVPNYNPTGVASAPVAPPQQGHTNTAYEEEKKNPL